MPKLSVAKTTALTSVIPSGFELGGETGHVTRDTGKATDRVSGVLYRHVRIHYIYVKRKTP